MFATLSSVTLFTAIASALRQLFVRNGASGRGTEHAWRHSAGRSKSLHGPDPARGRMLPTPGLNPSAHLSVQKLDILINIIHVNLYRQDCLELIFIKTLDFVAFRQSIEANFVGLWVGEAADPISPSVYNIVSSLNTTVFSLN